MSAGSFWKKSPELEEHLIHILEKHFDWNVDEILKELVEFAKEKNFSEKFLTKINKRNVSQKISSLKEEEEGVKLVIKLEKEIVKLKNERDWLRKKIKLIAETENLNEMVVSEVKRVAKSAPPVPVQKILLPKKEKGITIESAVLELSDIHFDENIKLSETQGLGVYNALIAARRIQQIVDTIIKITKKQFLEAYHLKELHIFGLGDWVSGTIHEELLRTGQSNIINQAYGLAYILYQALLELAQIFPVVYAHIMGGNHARFEKKPYFKEKYVNWDTVVGYTLSALLRKQKNIIFNIPLSIIDTVEIENYTFLLTHGDSVRSYGIMPYYGLQRAASQVELMKGGQYKENFRKIKANIKEIQQNFNVNNMEEMNQRDLISYIKLTETIFRNILLGSSNLVDTICMGHFHDNSTLLNGKIMINGSVVGPNEYILAKFMGNRPMQRFFGVHHEKGITWEFKLLLDLTDNDLTGLRYKMYDNKEQFAKQLKYLI